MNDIYILQYISLISSHEIEAAFTDAPFLDPKNVLVIGCDCFPAPNTSSRVDTGFRKTTMAVTLSSLPATQGGIEHQ